MVATCVVVTTGEDGDGDRDACIGIETGVTWRPRVDVCGVLSGTEAVECSEVEP